MFKSHFSICNNFGFPSPASPFSCLTDRKQAKVHFRNIGLNRIGHFSTNPHQTIVFQKLSISWICFRRRDFRLQFKNFLHCLYAWNIFVLFFPPSLSESTWSLASILLLSILFSSSNIRHFLRSFKTTLSFSTSSLSSFYAIFQGQSLDIIDVIKLFSLPALFFKCCGNFIILSSLAFRRNGFSFWYGWGTSWTTTEDIIQKVFFSLIRFIIFL